MKIHMILLAAGRGSRFGGNKLLYEVEGKPMYRHMLERLVLLRERLKQKREAGRLAVVTADPQIEACALELGAVCVRNSCQEKGISYSVRLGVEACGEEGGPCAYLFCPADQPWFTLDDLEGLVRGWLASGKSIGIAAQQGRPGSPCIFDRRYRSGLLSLSGDTGGKSIAKACPEEVYLYEISGDKGLEDMDFRPGTKDNWGKAGTKDEAAGRQDQKRRHCQEGERTEGGQLSESSDGCGAVQ